MTSTIHIRCGSDLERALPLAGYDGDFLEWTDPVCQGPVTGPVADDRYFDARARFIADDWGYDYDETIALLREQTWRLDALDGYDRVILWFEHDIFDQAILMRLCAELQGRSRLHDRLFIQTINNFPGEERFVGFGQLSPDQIATLKGQEKRVTAEMLDFGAKAWRAYSDSDPMMFWQLSQAAPETFPFLSAAAKRFFQDYPWTGDGLSLSERHCLRVIAGGVEKAGYVFRDTQSIHEPQPFMGDVMFWAILKHLSAADAPAITRIEGWTDAVELTPFGEDLLAGDADWTARNGIDRWFGGVHLTGKSPAWRWDEVAQSPVATA